MIFTSYKKILFAVFVLAVSCVFSITKIAAQTTDTSLLYGMTKSGLIYQVNVNTADCGTVINAPYPAGYTAAEANALGYDSVNKSFYYFLRNYNDPTQTFVAYNTVTQQYTTLSQAPLTGNVYRGCVNADGTGYYCMDLNSGMYYYDIATDKWTTITTNYVDQNDVSITSIFTSYSSGDMAFDGSGNLWILCSTGFNYALYKIPAAVTKTAVDTIVAQQYIADTALTPDQGYVFGGIAFSSDGEIYLSTGSPDNQLFLLQNNLKLADIGTLTIDGAGSDLASNNYPVTHLPVTYINFDGVLRNNVAMLTWSTSREINNKGFEVERSNDGKIFSDIGFVDGHGTSASINNYIFNDPKLVSGDNYYRLKQIDLDGNYKYSGVIRLSYSKFDWTIMGNPSNNMWLQLQLDKMHNVSVQIVSLSGTVISTINKRNLSQGTYGIPLDLNHVSAGVYVIRLLVDEQNYSKNIVK